LLKHAENYIPIPEKYLMAFARDVRKLLSGLSAYGIHLGPSSFAASVIPKRGLIFWDFFPREAGGRLALPNCFVQAKTLAAANSARTNPVNFPARQLPACTSSHSSAINKEPRAVCGWLGIFLQLSSPPGI